jgi:hypothetical protein
VGAGVGAGEKRAGGGFFSVDEDRIVDRCSAL